MFVAFCSRHSCFPFISSMLALFLGACGGGGSTNQSSSASQSSQPDNQYTISGTVTGLSGTGLTLQVNGAGDLSVATNGSFAFPAALAAGAAYTLSVRTQPGNPAQTCVVANGTGTVSNANVTGVAVNCSTNSYTLGGTISGLAGSGLMLQNNAGMDLAVATNGAFDFSPLISSGSVYNVTVRTQPVNPAQTCSVSNATGTITTSATTNIAVMCTTNNYVIGGTVTGLLGSGLVLRNNGGNDLAIAANGSFVFTNPVNSGASYSVSILTSPASPRQRCTITGATGVVAMSAINNIAITCSKVYSIGGTVAGLVGTGLVLQNNGGDNIAITANGSFTFPTPLSAGAAFTATVLTPPEAPRQSCALSNASNSVVFSDITYIQVNCTIDRFAYVANFGSDQIWAYTLNSFSGDLTEIPGGQFATGDGPRSVVSDPLRRFIYVANYNANTISAFTVNDISGALTSVIGSPFPAGSQPIDLAIDSEGTLLYAANFGSNNISAYLIEANGSLTPVTGSPFATGTNPRGLDVTPAQQCCYLYVANSNDDTVSAFEFDAQTGALTKLLGSPYAAGTQPFDVAVNSSGEFVHVVNYFSNSLTTFRLNGGVGTLTKVQDLPMDSSFSPDPCSIVSAPISLSLFITNYNAQTVSMYEPDITTFMPVEQGVPAPARSGACGIATDVSGNFVYVTNTGANSITAYKRGSSLLPIGTPIPTGVSPQSMAIRRNLVDLALLGILPP